MDGHADAMENKPDKKLQKVGKILGYNNGTSPFYSDDAYLYHLLSPFLISSLNIEGSAYWSFWCYFDMDNKGCVISYYDLTLFCGQTRMGEDPRFHVEGPIVIPNMECLRNLVDLVYFDP